MDSLPLRTSILIVASIGLALPVHAQWLKYPTAGVPLTADGRADLNAPPPRTVDGKPDLSAMWDIEHNNGCPPETCFDLSIGREFLNIGSSLKDGLPYRPWAEALVRERVATLRKDDPYTHCLPIGIVRLHTIPLMKKIMQSPGLIVILNELLTGYRQIFTDGRPLPVDPQPAWNGYSTGRWDGDTLVVESSGFRDGLWLDAKGSPLTDAAKITERFRRATYGKMEIDVRIDDPKAYTAPFTVRLNQFIVLNSEMIDAFCLENEKSTAHFVVGK